MEWVALTDADLRQLARTDPTLKRVFVGVFPENRLPDKPSKTGARAAYIVNTDPEGEPGTHWLAMWKEGGTCEVFDSYGLPLDVYGVDNILEWLNEHCPDAVRSNKTLQAMNSRACGHYAILYLKAKVQGKSMETFLNEFSATDFVLNDHIAGALIRELIKTQGPPLEKDFGDGCCSQHCKTRKRVLELIKSDV